MFESFPWNRVERCHVGHLARLQNFNAVFNVLNCNMPAPCCVAMGLPERVWQTLFAKVGQGCPCIMTERNRAGQITLYVKYSEKTRVLSS